MIVFIFGVTDELFKSFTAPADASLFAHHIKSKDARVRAEFARRNSNFECVFFAVRLMLRFFIIQLVAEWDMNSIAAAYLITLIPRFLVKCFQIWYAVPTNLNVDRMQIVLKHWAQSSLETASPLAVNREIGLVIKPSNYLKFGNFQFNLGVNIKDFIVFNDLRELMHKHENLKFVLNLNVTKKTIDCILKEGATSQDQIKASLLAQKLSIAFSKEPQSDFINLLEEEMKNIDIECDSFCRTLKTNGFQFDSVLLLAGEWRLRSFENDVFTAIRKTNSGILVEKYQLEIASDSKWMIRSLQAQSPRSSFKDVFKQILFPFGFPESVCSEYVTYQVWDTLQVSCENLRSVILHQYWLLSIGVGNSNIKPSEIVNQDIILCALSKVLSLITGMSCKAGTSSQNMKSWRLYSTLQKFINCLLEVFKGANPQYRFPIECGARSFNAILDPLKGGMNQMLTLHLGNYSVDPAFLGDVSLKESNQDRLLGFLQMPSRLCLLWLIQTDISRAVCAVFALTFGHIVFNILAAKSLVLKKLNLSMLSIVLATYFKEKRTISPKHVANKDRLIRFSDNLCFRRVKINLVCANELFGQGVFGGKEYNIEMYSRREITITVKRNAPERQQAQSIFQAYQIIDDMERSQITFIEARKKWIRFNSFLKKLRARDWDTENFLVRFC